MSKTKKILVILITIMFLTLTIFTVTVNAEMTDMEIIDDLKVNDNRTAINIKESYVENRKDIFCIQHNTPLPKPNALLYSVKGPITIDGNTSSYKKIIDGEAVKGLGTNTDKINGTLAYILAKGIDAGGYGKTLNYTYGQIALWHYYEEWYNTIIGQDDSYKEVALAPSNQNKIVPITEDAQNLINEAKAYAERIGNGSQAAIDDKTNKDSTKITPYINTKNDNAYVRVGPFEFNYTGKLIDMKAYSDSECKNEISSIMISKFEGTQEVFINNTDIQSGEKFYLTLSATDIIKYGKVSKIKATVEPTEKDVLQGNVWFLYHNQKQKLVLADFWKKTDFQNAYGDFDYNIKLTRDLAIEKVDSRDNKIKLEGVGFIIQNKETGKYVAQSRKTIKYVDDKKDATEFKTDKNGRLSVNGLIIGNYVAYETKNPNYGYKQISGSIKIAVNESKKVIPNEQKYVKLSGYVWKDIQSSKRTVRNDLYKTNSSDYADNKDEAFNGITVRLKDKNGNIVKNSKGNNQEVTTKERGLYKEIDGGEYVFNDVLIDELENYYVEFEYDGLIYQSVAVHKKENSGSKATDKVERKVLDKNFTSVNATGENKVNVNDKYSITYNDTVKNTTSIKDSSDCILHANTKDAGYEINKYFTAGTEEIRYVNLGLYEKQQADLSLTQDLYNVNVGVNGYWHVYNYAKRTLTGGGYEADNESTWNVGVKFKNSYTGTYKRAIYKSDLDYERQDDRNKELQVYLTYKIAITNESSYLTKANSIIDYFDSRYTLVAVGTGLDGQNNITGNVSYQTPERYNDSYQKCIINVGTTVKSGESNYIYIQFKLDRAATLQIMNNKETLSNKAEINSYTVYKDNNGNTVAAVDRDSVPGNTKIENINTYEDDTDSAPSIQLELSDSRKIQGTTFVDSTSGELLTGQIRQGNGIFDNGEKTIAGVKVTLHELNNSISDMTTTTDANGNFEFANYIPGQYTITYTWGDKTYTVQNYKGTVYDSNRNQNNMYWYKDDINTRKTDAIDNYQSRLNIDKEIASVTNNTINDQISNAYDGGNNHPNITITTMDSITPTMEFGVEYETTVTDGTIDKVEFIVRNVDFGIVERAKQQLDMTKRVKSFKITLANGQVLADATVDEKRNLQGIHDYVTYMGPSTSNGYSNKGFIKAELDNELIEGATLEVGYEIKFINNSEVDYMSEKYYKYGIQEGNVVTLTPSAVVDYLDKNLGFEQNKNSDWKQITVEDLKNLNAVKVEDAEFLNSRNILYTESTAKPIKPTETISAKLNVSKLLSTSSDLTFDNDAETVKVDKPESEYHRGSVIKYFPTDRAEEVDITPSTGKNKDYVLPTVVGMVVLVVLGTGVFVIKKYVIDRK